MKSNKVYQNGKNEKGCTEDSFVLVEDAKDKNVLPEMIEIHRKLYMEEDCALRNENFGKTRQMIRHVLRSVQKEFSLG